MRRDFSCEDGEKEEEEDVNEENLVSVRISDDLRGGEGEENEADLYKRELAVGTLVVAGENDGEFGKATVQDMVAF